MLKLVLYKQCISCTTALVSHAVTSTLYVVEWLTYRTRVRSILLYIVAQVEFDYVATLYTPSKA